MCQPLRPADAAIEACDIPTTAAEAKLQLPKARLNPRAQVFVASITSSEVSSEAGPASEVDDHQVPDPHSIDTDSEEQEHGSVDYMHAPGVEHVDAEHPAWGWESPQGVLPPSPYEMQPHHASKEDGAEEGTGEEDAAPEARPGSGPRPVGAAPHHPYSWGAPYPPVYYPDLAGFERSASPPGAYPAGGSPPVAPGFISVPVHHGMLDPGSPTAGGMHPHAVMYHHHHPGGGSPPGYPHPHHLGGGSPPPYGTSPPLSLGSSPPGGHYVFFPGDYHPGYAHAVHHEHHQQHHQQRQHQQQDCLTHGMSGLALGPGSTGSGGSAGGGPSRASARIARSHRAGGAYNPSQFEFSLEEAERGGAGARTTVMVRNVPNKYTQRTMLEVLAKAGFAGDFDFFYLPIDFRNRCGLGYAFVNMRSPAAAARLYRAFHAYRWEEHNSRKVCEVTYARVQGRDALVEHFRAAKFPSEEAEYQPLVYRSAGEGGEGAAGDRALPIHAFLAAAERRAEGGDGGGEP